MRTPVLAKSVIFPALALLASNVSDASTQVTPPLADSSCVITQADDRIIVSLTNEPMLSFEKPTLADEQAPKTAVTDVGQGFQHVSMKWHIDRRIQQDRLAIPFKFLFEPDFHWMPHLTPKPGYVVGQHVFRSPAIIAAQDQKILAIVPDLDLVGRNPDNPWYFDTEAPANCCWLGMARTEIPVHVGFKAIPGMELKPGPIELAFFVCAYRDDNVPTNPWSRVSHFLWQRWARPLYAKGQPGRVPMDTYVQHTYHWAFDSWKHAVWQEFDLADKHVGAPQFIVNISQSPNYKDPWYQRETRSIWNQAWFSSLRSASGLARWARRTNNKDLTDKANLTKELALATPVKDGIFPSVITTANENVEIEGQTVTRPKPWSQAYWTNSNRCPKNYGISRNWYHILDASWTCLLMLRWHEEIEADPRLLQFATRYANKLLTLQDEQGFFPGWLNPDTLEPAKIMSQTPETAMSVTFLLKLADKTGNNIYRQAALTAMDALLVEIVPNGCWEDFETYWSCSKFGRDMVGKKFARNNMYKQNNFSMFWTAEALLESYRITKNKTYLAWGRRTLDELSMTQQVWQPPFIHVPALGGFGVMNFDGEWNDARQSLFAELFMEYYKETHDPHLFERGIAALKASFVMMYCPENPKQKDQWEKAHPHFGPEDYGFMMENYGHGGRTNTKGKGIGDFTIYDWGNGAASEARNRIYDHFGDVYLDRNRHEGFGIDSITVEANATGFKLTDLANQPRKIKVTCEDGSSEAILLNKNIQIEYQH